MRYRAHLGYHSCSYLFLITALFLSCNSCLFFQQTSQPYPNEINFESDYWPFDCEELPDYLEQYGVTDVNGNSHPGYAGWTIVTFYYSPFTYSRGFSSREGFYCPCDGVVYETLEDCLANCEVTLGCFTGICEQVGQTCVVSNDVDVTFYAIVDVSVAKWDPSGNLSETCLVEKLRWEDDIIQHEQHHVEDIKRLVDEANQRWRSAQSFEACGFSEADADNNLREIIQQALIDEIGFLEQETERLVNEFHSSPEGGPIRSIDCELCD